MKTGIINFSVGRKLVDEEAYYNGARLHVSMHRAKSEGWNDFKLPLIERFNGNGKYAHDARTYSNTDRRCFLCILCMLHLNAHLKQLFADKSCATHTRTHTDRDIYINSSTHTHRVLCTYTGHIEVNRVHSLFDMHVSFENCLYRTGKVCLYTGGWIKIAFVAFLRKSMLTNNNR